MLIPTLLAAAEDLYEVCVRSADCRMLTAKLVIKGAPIED